MGDLADSHLRQLMFGVSFMGGEILIGILRHQTFPETLFVGSEGQVQKLKAGLHKVAGIGRSPGSDRSLALRPESQVTP